MPMRERRQFKPKGKIFERRPGKGQVPALEASDYPLSVAARSIKKSKVAEIIAKQLQAKSGNRIRMISIGDLKNEKIMQLIQELCRILRVRISDITHIGFSEIRGNRFLFLRGPMGEKERERYIEIHPYDIEKSSQLKDKEKKRLMEIAEKLFLVIEPVEKKQKPTHTPKEQHTLEEHILLQSYRGEITKQKRKALLQSYFGKITKRKRRAQNTIQKQ